MKQMKMILPGHKGAARNSFGGDLKGTSSLVKVGANMEWREHL
jgi:hypothetical protein